MRLYKTKIILISSVLVVGFLGTPANAGGNCTATPNRNTFNSQSYSCTGLGNPSNGFNQGPTSVYVQPKPGYGSNGYLSGKTSNGLTTVMCKKDSFGRMVCK